MDFPDSKITGPNTHLAKRKTFNGYPDMPGTGPDGERCKTCRHIHGFRQGGRWFKCELRKTAWTGGRGTDIKANSPACSKWEGIPADLNETPSVLTVPALSLHQPYASWVLDGSKAIETRTWYPWFKPPFTLLICATKKKNFVGTTTGPYGVALCTVEVYGWRPMEERDVPLARCGLYPGAKAWLLRNVMPVKQVEVRGAQRIFRVPLEKRIHLINYNQQEAR